MTPTMIKLLIYFVVWDLVVCLYDLKNGRYNGFWGNLIIVSKSVISLCLILMFIFQLRYLG